MGKGMLWERPLGVGAGTVIKKCIVDKNARIKRNVKIVNQKVVEVRAMSWKGGSRGWDYQHNEGCQLGTVRALCGVD